MLNLYDIRNQLTEESIREYINWGDLREIERFWGNRIAHVICLNNSKYKVSKTAHTFDILIYLSSWNKSQIPCPLCNKPVLIIEDPELRFKKLSLSILIRHRKV